MIKLKSRRAKVLFVGAIVAVIAGAGASLAAFLLRTPGIDANTGNATVTAKWLVGNTNHKVISSKDATCSIQAPTTESGTVVVSMTGALEGAECVFESSINLTSTIGAMRTVKIELPGLQSGYAVSLVTCGDEIKPAQSGTYDETRWKLARTGGTEGANGTSTGGGISMVPATSWTAAQCAS